MSARHQPQTPKGFLFVTTEEEDALVNAFVGGSIYQRSHTVILNCFLLILKATVQKQPGGRSVLAGGASGDAEIPHVTPGRPWNPSLRPWANVI
jgi:hypothetical protein